MGAKKKKQASQHATQSFGSMVSKAALVQLLPDIKEIVAELGSKIAMEQANAMELLYLRLLVLEQASGLTQEQLTERVIVLEDSLQGLQQGEQSKLGDTLRIQLQVKENKEGAEYNPPQIRRIDSLGRGQTLGPAIEAQLVNLKAGDVKEIPLGETHTAKITISRVSTPIPGVQPEAAAPVVATPVETTADIEPKNDSSPGEASATQVQG